METFFCFLKQFLTRLKRMQWFNIFRLGFGIPGTQHIQAEPFFFLNVYFFNKRKYMQLHRLMKLKTIFLSVIKPAHLNELVIAVIFEAGILRNLVPFFNKL